MASQIGSHSQSHSNNHSLSHSVSHSHSHAHAHAHSRHQAQPSTSSTADSPSSTRAHTPAASTSGQPATGTLSNKPQRILACVLCQHRKIKCDRTFPCANCLKANVTCTPSTPAPARKRRRPNQDLQERLARCEELLKEYAAAKPDSPPATKAASPTPTDHIPELDDPLPKWKPAGKLIEEDDGVRFMDSYLLTTVWDELKSMRKIVDDELATDQPTPMTSDDAGAETPDDNSELLFGTTESPNMGPQHIYPKPAHIILLWQIYLDRCNPLTKIIHVPTVQPYMLEATAASPQVPKNVEALLFAIFLLATVTMSKDECQETLGMSREKATARFGHGVRMTLARLQFLKCHDLFSLQALVIYLISLQGRYNRHASWVLNGLVIRIAQKMGLHRDGEQLGLKPLETEMRRRLWWQIILVDAKYAMLSGLSHTLLPRGWDTKVPKNVNDEDLLPSATEPVEDRDSPTDMILVIVICKIAHAIMLVPGADTFHLLSQMETSPRGMGANKEQVEECRAVIAQVSGEIDDMFAKYDKAETGPLHDLARHLKEHLLGKFAMAIKSPGHQSEWGSEVFDHTSNTFRVAVETITHSIGQYKLGSYSGWDWFARLHFQLDVFAYLIGQLGHRTTGPLVDKAWIAIEDGYKYHPELLEVHTHRSYYQIAHFVFKAWRKREQVLQARLGAAPEVPKFVQQLRMLTGTDDSSSVKSEPGRTPQEGVYQYPGADGRAGVPGGSALDFSAADGAPFDAYMGNYFDFNSALDFDIWGNAPPTVPNGLPSLDPLSQQPPQQPPMGDMLPYGFPGPTWK